MPIEAGIDLSREIVRGDTLRKEYRHANTLLIIPVSYVLKACTSLNRQAGACLPLIVNRYGGILIGHIADRS